MKKSSIQQNALIVPELVEPVICLIRGLKVILDAVLARIYGVTTKRLNEQVRRSASRFPEDFMFSLTAAEARSLRRSRSQSGTLNRSQFATGSQKHRDPRYLPYALTEHGAVMPANVLNNERAVAMSVFVVRAFVKLREVLSSTSKLAKKLEELERKSTARQDVREKAILQLFAQIKNLLSQPPPQPQAKRRRIGF